VLVGLVLKLRLQSADRIFKRADISIVVFLFKKKAVELDLQLLDLDCAYHPLSNSLRLLFH
jgi:hypothetical protein